MINKCAYIDNEESVPKIYPVRVLTYKLYRLVVEQFDQPVSTTPQEQSHDASINNIISLWGILVQFQ